MPHSRQFEIGGATSPTYTATSIAIVQTISQARRPKKTTEKFASPRRGCRGIGLTPKSLGSCLIILRRARSRREHTPNNRNILIGMVPLFPEGSSQLSQVRSKEWPRHHKHSSCSPERGLWTVPWRKLDSRWIRWILTRNATQPGPVTY